jgi:DNA-binding MarR family transcriptional regulator
MMSDLLDTRPEIVGSTDHERGLADLLAAFQYLQGRNARLASALSARLGMGQPDLRVLLYLSRMPDATPKEVATQLEQASGSVTALLDRLERSGHLLRSAHPTDRRSLTLRLTDSGEGVVRAVRGSYRDAFAGLFSSEELERAAAVLRTLGSALGPEAIGRGI